MTAPPPVGSISVFGLGKVGCPLAAALAHKGFRVIGVDLSGQVVERLNAGVAPVQEPGLQAMLEAGRNRFRATTDGDDAVASSQLSFVIVPTPTGPDGTFVLDHVMEVVTRIGEALARKQAYHLVTVVSTVMPGDTDRLRVALESASGRSCGRDFGLCYSPEFIALGSVLANMLHPDMLLIGESDARAGDLLEAVLLRLTDKAPAVRRMSFVNAELTKLAINSYVTMKISYANMIARVCERLPGADAAVVTAAVGTDGRVGTRYLTGALPYGGPCFPRDNVALARAAERVGGRAPLALATNAFNRSQSRDLADLLGRHLAPGARVAVLGLAYKPDTPVVEESASLHLIRDLVDLGFPVTAHDPEAMPGARLELDSLVSYALTADGAVGAADAVVVATAWESFKALDPESLRRHGRKVMIVDCWRILDRTRFEGVADVLYLGTHWGSATTAGVTARGDEDREGVNAD